MTTKIHIREIRPSQAEVDQMESVGLAAFTNIAFHRLMFPRGEETRAEERRWRSQRLRGSLMNPAKRFVVAVEETVLEDGKSTSKIVGWSQWATPPDVLAPEKTEEEKENEWQERMKSWPDAMDKQAYRKIQEAFEGYEKQWLAGTDPRDYFGEYLFPTVCSALKLTLHSSRCACRAPGTPEERIGAEADHMGHRGSCQGWKGGRPDS